MLIRWNNNVKQNMYVNVKQKM